MAETTLMEAYVDAVRARLGSLRAAEREDALAELASLLAVDAARAGEPAAVAALGDPADYAARVLEAFGVEQDLSEADGGPVPQGRVLGMPYDFRGASVDRIASRVWNPADPRIFMPRMFGVGWTVNLGAVAVRLGLIRPDDVADESYERVPRALLAGIVAVPGVFAAAAAAVLLVAWPSLPAEVPIHWGVNGAPDDWASRTLVIAALLALAVGPAALTYAGILRRGVSARARLLSAAALGMETVLVLGVALLTVLDADGGASGDWMWLVVVAVIVVPFLMLYAPARAGLHAEWREAGSR